MRNHYHWKSSRSCRNKCNNPYCYKHLPRDHPSKITTKISKLLLHATKEFPNALIYFSAILPKFNNTFFEMINHVNSEIFELCSYYHQLHFHPTPGLCKKSRNKQRAFLERYDPYEYQRSTATGKRFYQTRKISEIS